VFYNYVITYICEVLNHRLSFGLVAYNILYIKPSIHGTEETVTTPEAVQKFSRSYTYILTCAVL